MASVSSSNKNNSAVKRIMQEARELANDPCTDYSAAPLEDDIFEWHCTLRGPAGTEFEGGLYHFRILLPAEYPFRPPSIMMLTPNGRFELNTKICISFTSYHEELWQPAWGVRTAIIGLQGFFPLKGQAAVGVGSIEYPSTERKRLAALSRNWVCPQCEQCNLDLLPDPKADEEPSPSVLSPPTPASETLAPVELPQASRATAVFSTDTILQDPHSAEPPNIPEPQPAVHSVDPLMPGPSAGRNSAVPLLTPSASFISRSPTGTPPAQQVHQPLSMRRSSHRPPLLLDTAICVLIALACAMFCRRLV